MKLNEIMFNFINTYCYSAVTIMMKSPCSLFEQTPKQGQHYAFPQSPVSWKPQKRTTSSLEDTCSPWLRFNILSAATSSSPNVCQTCLHMITTSVYSPHFLFVWLLPPPTHAHTHTNHSFALNHWLTISGPWATKIFGPVTQAEVFPFTDDIKSFTQLFVNLQ